MFDLELEVATLTPEENELIENDMIPIDNFGMESDWDEIELFSQDEWKTVRYYLRDLKHFNCLEDLLDYHDEIILDFRGLGLLDQEGITKYIERVDMVLRCYHLDR